MERNRIFNKLWLWWRNITSRSNKPWEIYKERNIPLRQFSEYIYICECGQYAEFENAYPFFRRIPSFLLRVVLCIFLCLRVVLCLRLRLRIFGARRMYRKGFLQKKYSWRPRTGQKPWRMSIHEGRGQKPWRMSKWLRGTETGKKPVSGNIRFPFCERLVEFRWCRWFWETLWKKTHRS